MQQTQAGDSPQDVLARKFVRVTHRRPDGLVEFEFAIGERALFVEMMLPDRAFDEFCGIHSVTRIDDGQEEHALSALPC